MSNHNGQEKAVEALDFLFSAQGRYPLLLILRNRNRSVSELNEALNSSKATLNRDLRRLESRNWIKRTGNKCTLTPVGKRIVEELTGTVTEINRIEQINTLLDVLPTEFATKSWIFEAEVVISDDYNPYRPLERFFSTLRNTDTVRTIAPYSSGLYDEKYIEFIRCNDTNSEVILCDRIIQNFDKTDADYLAELKKDTTTTLYVTDKAIQYGLSIHDDQAIIGGYNQLGQLQALGIVTNADAVTWAKEKFAECSDRSRTIGSSGLCPK